MNKEEAGGESTPPAIHKANKYIFTKVFVRKTCGGKAMEKQFTARTEYEQVVLDELAPQYSHETAEVTQSVSMKVSDSVYWGDGTWDRIPYSIEVFSSVKLMCDQSSLKIDMAKELANDMACNGAREHMVKALASHVKNIKTNLYKGLFNETT